MNKYVRTECVLILGCTELSELVPTPSHPKASGIKQKSLKLAERVHHGSRHSFRPLLCASCVELLMHGIIWS